MAGSKRAINIQGQESAASCSPKFLHFVPLEARNSDVEGAESASRLRHRAAKVCFRQKVQANQSLSHEREMKARTRPRLGVHGLAALRRILRKLYMVPPQKDAVVRVSQRLFWDPMRPGVHLLQFVHGPRLDAV